MPSLNGAPGTKEKAGLDRRDALKLLSAGMAATLARCSKPDQDIVPYVNMPEGLAAGEPLKFATALFLSGYARGCLATSIDGRPIKIEGNPRHPYSLGATDVFMEADVLGLYDPDRSQVARHKGIVANWPDFAAAWREQIASKTSAADLRIGLVTGRILSPTSLRLIDALKNRFPRLRRYRYEPVNDDNAQTGAKLAFGRNLTALPRLADADVVLALGADPLGHGPEQLHYARAFAQRRGGKRQRFYCAESLWSLTGAASDLRYTGTPQALAEIAAYIAKAFGADAPAAILDDKAKAFADAAIHDIRDARGRAVVLAGEGQSPDIHAVGHWLNAQWAAPIDYIEPLDFIAEFHSDALEALVSDLHAKNLDALVLLDVNPVYDAIDKLQIAEGIGGAPFSVHLGSYVDESARLCQWHIPLSHTLESWGDGRAPDGTTSLVQPLIRTLYGSKTHDEFLAALAGDDAANAYDVVRATWSNHAGGDFTTWWNNALENGVVAESAAPLAAKPPPRAPAFAAAAKTSALTLLLSPHPSLWDGRFANNAWLQECPQPFNKESWGNALHIAPGDAARNGVVEGDRVLLQYSGQSVECLVTILAGQAEGAIGGYWGQGRSHAGRIGDHVGSRLAGLGETSFARTFANITLKKIAAAEIASTQGQTRIHGEAEELYPTLTLTELAQHASEIPPPAPSLLTPYPHGDYAWAMVIDADVCIGCNSCVVACQAENNVPVVGPEEILRGRDMHWLRVDVYELKDPNEDRRGFQPVPCMQCEQAPCEPVCPVAASVHDHEGLNVQVYNRCIGTRFCEANCPYKVRRFNWFDYSGEQAYANQDEPPLKAQRNPDVSVRGRGVMEKCNYCLQRISRARKTAEKEDRTVAEGEMVTACQAACPTRAIHFGDLNKPDSDVSKLRHSPRHYTLLESLNTKPRTTYLKRVLDDSGNGTP